MIYEWLNEKNSMDVYGNMRDRQALIARNVDDVRDVVALCAFACSHLSDERMADDEPERYSVTKGMQCALMMCANALQDASERLYEGDGEEESEQTRGRFLKFEIPQRG